MAVRNSQAPGVPVSGMPRPTTILTSQSTTTQTGVLSADFTYTTATVTLTPGTWVVTAGASLINTVTTDGATVGIWNTTASAIVVSSTGAAGHCTLTTSASVVSVPTVITVAANTVVNPQCRRSGGSTISAQSFAGGPAAWIIAQQIG